MFASDVDSETDTKQVKEKRTEICSCCAIKDYSPLGLLGIFLITASFIIVIYDAKDALPEKASPYFIVLEVALIVAGVGSIFFAFMGYRRARAFSREINGTKGKRNKIGACRTISYNYNHTNNTLCTNYDYIDLNQSIGPSLVSAPKEYDVFVPMETFRFHGQDNLAFQKNPAHDATFTVPRSSCKNRTKKKGPGSPKQRTATLYPGSPKHRTTTLYPGGPVNNNVQSVPLEAKRSSNDAPKFPCWPDLDLPNYIPAVSTMV